MKSLEAELESSRDTVKELEDWVEDRKVEAVKWELVHDLEN